MISNRFATFALTSTLIAACSLYSASGCWAADAAKPTTTTDSIPRPLRITVGYDGSSTTGDREGGLQIGDFNSFTTNQDGAFRIGVSYDIWQDRERAWTGSIYMDNDLALFDPSFYFGVGIAARRDLGSRAGMHAYAGAGVGIYNVWLPDADGLGLKLFVGLQDQSAIFVEVGFTPIAVSGYTPQVTFVIGLRL